MRRKKALDCTILKQYRLEAFSRLSFQGAWSGYWETKIDGIWFRGPRVSGFCYVMGDDKGFMRNAILERVRLRREDNTTALSIARYKDRYLDEEGKGEWWMK